MQNQERERLQILLKKVSKQRTHEAFERAFGHSQSVIESVKVEINAYAKAQSVDLTGICLVAVGSVGRGEAGVASDLDLIPIASNAHLLKSYEPHDKAIRQRLREALSMKVSEGDNLTAPTALTNLTAADCIGGERDSSGALTKRILILTESEQIAGDLTIGNVRLALLNAYTQSDRTSGPHVLAMCNDVARYFRTLCVEYKAKVDDENKPWGTRNLKLRHSRKLWYFSLMVAISALVQQFPSGRLNYKEAVLDTLSYPPVLRLLRALPSDEFAARIGNILDHYAWFLLFMEAPSNRERLAQIDHDKRFDLTNDNPFPHLKLNSDLMHQAMIKLVDELPATVRDKVFAWFLL